ncbi:Pup--protein ligase [Brevibacterium sp. 5221]|uniref:Pup--protein ligase n=1 Tax=Brevibacterium rongguiense TaxID=2695267 RepID=A0A6N9H521_9MICO|nr:MULTISPECIES: Pup--protein ligase [Brevibacterium]MYM18931.1 Pup--protein ligase [Brevibacterium rongguiense]WAL40778.1 Pup--protein ligase [Brevibacterium sp. BRM-1]
MKRIFGLETEYGIAFTPSESGRRLGPEEIARYLFRPVVAWGRSSNVFLPNGARLYLDVGSHPEYATAECDRLPDLVAQDGAGQAIMVDLLGRAQDALADEGAAGTAHLVKNNKDSAGNSYGSHENFLIRRSVDFKHLTGVLLPFLVARQLLVGAGAVLPAGISTEIAPADANRAPSAGQAPPVRTGELVYGLSARSDVMWEGVSSATTRSRPIINARDEPHADAEKYRRLHVIVGDSSMSQTTSELKVGSAGLVLDLIEAGVPLEDLSLRNPIRDIRRIARDLTGSTVLELRSGATLTARELLGRYLERAAALVAAGDHSLGDDAAAARVIDRWERMLAALETGDFSAVDTEIDWVIKKKLIDRYLERSEAGLADPRVQRLDVAYHDLTPGSGLFPRLEAAGLAARVVDAAAIEAAKDCAPATTRAAIRGDFVAAAHDARRDYTVDWVHLRLNDHAQRAVVLKDPFAHASEPATALIAALRADTAPSGPPAP